MYYGPRERARDAGLDVLSDAELLAIVISTGTRGRSATTLAEDLLEHFGGLDGLARAGVGSLTEADGMGMVKALRIAASLDIGRRLGARRSLERNRVGSSDDVAAFGQSILGGIEHEEMWLLALDGQNGVRAARRVAQGGLHGCSVTARDILRLAIREAASAFVLLHNHPSLDPTPSQADLRMTRAVVEAGDVVGVPLVDHVIVSGSKHTSFLDEGLLA
jgi:DNA repair protein RadC